MTTKGSMSMRALAIMIGAAGGLGAVPALADDETPPVTGGHTYVQHLAEVARARHPGVLAIEVVGKGEEGKPGLVLAATADRARVLTPAAPMADSGIEQAGARTLVHLPYLSSTHHQLGAMTVAFAKGHPAAAAQKTAAAIAAEMARDTLSAKNAGDPYPFDPAWGPGTYAQALTTRTVARHPDLLVMMIHATPPGHDKNIIIGSNIGRFGKIADEDDARVIDKGETNLEIGGEKDRFETELPLLDASGKRIGALGLVFDYRDGQDKEAIHRHGLAIRDEIARQIPTSAALFRHAR